MVYTTQKRHEVSNVVIGGVSSVPYVKRTGSRKLMRVSELVQTLRRRTNMKQWQFAKALRVTRGAVAAYETGQMNPSFKVLDKMARLAGLTVADLLTVPTIAEKQDRTLEDTTARANLEICLNSPNRELVITTLAFFAGRSPRVSQ